MPDLEDHGAMKAQKEKRKDEAQEKVDNFLRAIREFDHRTGNSTESQQNRNEKRMPQSNHHKKYHEDGKDQEDNQEDTTIAIPCDELHHRSTLGEDLKFGDGISAKQYIQYMMEMNPTLAISYGHYTRCWPCWCTWSPCCSSSQCTCSPCCHPHYCTPHCGVPKPCIYWFLNMFISAIALTLEMDFIGLAYNWRNDAFNSENQIIAMCCIWATVAYSFTNFVLICTVAKCVLYTPGNWPCCKSSNSHSGNNNDNNEDETCLNVCPTLTVGSIDDDDDYPGRIERFFSIRIRWWMLVPCCRLIFVLVVNGNADANLSFKTMDDMRQEKTTNFRSLAIIGMLNTFTVTVPNMVMGWFSLQESGGFEDGSVMDSIFFFTSCFSFGLTMISMCYGVLDAVVHTIDFMDKLLNDVQELEEHQHKCIKYAKWHLDELADMIHYIHNVLHALKKNSLALFRPRSKALLRAVKKHIPEDKEMLDYKNLLMKTIDPNPHESRSRSASEEHIYSKSDVKEIDLGGGKMGGQAPKLGESEIKDIILDYYAYIDCWMHQYMADLKKSCIITKMDHHLILKKYMPLLIKREKVERQEMLDCNQYFNRDEETMQLVTEKVQMIYNDGKKPSTTN